MGKDRNKELKVELSDCKKNSVSTISTNELKMKLCG